jgi:hypothetical protein
MAKGQRDSMSTPKLRAFRFDKGTVELLEKLSDGAGIPQVAILRLAIHCLARQLPQLIDPPELPESIIRMKKVHSPLGRDRTIADAEPIDPFDAMEPIIEGAELWNQS